MECIPCGKTFSGQVPYQQHLESIKHKRKIQSYAIFNGQSNSSPVLNDGSIEKKLHCYACGISFNSSENYLKHSLTQEHAVKVLSQNLDQKSSLNCNVVSSSDLKIKDNDECTDQKMNGNYECTDQKMDGNYECTDQKMNGNYECTDQKMNGNYECTDQKMNDTGNENKSGLDDMILDELKGNKSPQFPHFANCNVCDKQFSGPEPYKQHLESALHLKKAGMQKPVHQPASLFCEPCKKVFSGQIPYIQHMDSEVHKKKIEENSLKINNSNSYFCNICKISCTGLIPYQQHLKGIPHLKKAKQQNIVLSSGNPSQPCSNGENGISWNVVNEPQCTDGINQDLGNEKMETDYILPELGGNLKIMSTEELQKSIKMFLPDESIDFDKSETQMHGDPANENVEFNSLEKNKIQDKEKQMDGTKRNAKVCLLCNVELLSAEDVASHYESVEHFNKRWC